jgi:large-conductance mechanosensitive channel
MQKIKKLFKKFVAERRGEGFLDVAMKILIVVVIGAAVLAILNAAVPSLFEDLIGKISDSLTGVNVLP